MTKRTTFTTTSPSGDTFTRTSDSRTYTHAVLVRQNYEDRLAHAARIAPYDLDSGRYALARLAGHYSNTQEAWPELRSWETQIGRDDDMIRAVDDAKKRLAIPGSSQLITTPDEFAQRCAWERVAHIKAIAPAGVMPWFVFSWVGRPDLVAAQLSAATKGHPGATVTHSPVTVATK